MKVAFLLGALNVGGKEVLLLDVLSQKDELPFAPFCVYRKDGILSQRFLGTGVPLKKINTKPIIKFLWHLRNYVRSNQIDIIHAQGSFDAALAEIATIGMKVKTVQTIHGLDESSGEGRINLQKLMMRCCSRTVFVSKYQQDFYIKKYSLSKKLQDKTLVIYNGLDLSKFDVEPVEVPLPRCFDKGLRLITVGNFVAGRRHFLICKFLKLLTDAKVEFDFYFVGREDVRQEWRYNECYSFCEQNGLLNRVHFLGSRNDVPQLLKQMDAFVYSSDADTFGIAVIEAIYSGLLVFVNDFEVMQEITLDGNLATLYKSGDENDLLDKFSAALKNNHIATKNSNEIMSVVASCFSIESHVAGLNNLYVSILS